MGLLSFVRQMIELKQQVSQLQDTLDSVKRHVIAETERNEERFWALYQEDGENRRHAQSRFFNRLPKAEGDMRLIQDCVCVLLKDFGRRCSEAGIPYWLDFGTLLGSVRHRGFIPWDDDADVGVLLCDLPRIKAAYQNDSIFAFDEFIAANEGSVCRVFRVKFKDEHNPCFLDIFPYEYLTDTRDTTDIWADYIDARNCFVEKAKRLWSAEDRMNSPYAKCADAAIRDRVASENAIAQIEELENAMHSSLGARIGLSKEQTGRLIWSPLSQTLFVRKLVYRADDFFPFETGIFEGESYAVPGRSSVILEKNFGDYYRMPWDMGSRVHLSLSETNRACIKKQLLRCSDAASCID